MKKRFWALLLAVMMVVSVLPTAAFAVDGGDALEQGEVRATKSLVSTEPDQDGWYTIQLTVEGKPKTSQVSADVILCIDVSNSMDTVVVSGVCEGDISTEYEAVLVEEAHWEDGHWERHHGMWYWVPGRWVPAKYEYVITGYTCDKCGKTWDSDEQPPEKCDVVYGEGKTLDRMDIAKKAAAKMAEDLLTNPGINMAVVAFGGAGHKYWGQSIGGENDTYLASTDLTDEKSKITTFIGQLDTPSSLTGYDDGGGTNYTSGLGKVRDILDARTDKERVAYVLFLSDGKPGKSGDSADKLNWNGITQANTIKQSTGERDDHKPLIAGTIYTGGIAIDDEDNDALVAISSTDKEGNVLYQGISNENMAADLAKLMAVVTQAAKKAAGTQAVLTDIVNTDDFIFDTETAQEQEGVSVAVDGKTVSWSIGEITESPKVITLKVKPKDGKSGELFTNEDVQLEYVDVNGNNAEKDKDDIGDPSVYLPCADLSVEKSITSIGSKTPVTDSGAITTVAEVGDVIVWTITVINNGGLEGKIKLPVDTLNDANGIYKDITVDPGNNIVQDGYYSVPAGTMDEDEKTWTPGQISFTASYTVTESDYGKNLVNTVEVTDDSEDSFNAEAPGIPVEEKDTTIYTVTYSWSGLPTDGIQPQLPATKSYEEKSEVTVDTTWGAGSTTFAGTDGNNYVFSGWDTEDAEIKDGKFTIEKNVTLSGTWDLDNWHDANPNDPEDKDSDKGGDGIPDKYQAVIQYVSENDAEGNPKGSVSFAQEVVTVKDEIYFRIPVANGKIKITGSKATAADGYLFKNWTSDENLTFEGASVAELTGQRISGVQGGRTYTFTAHFDEAIPGLELSKTVKSIGGVAVSGSELPMAVEGDVIVWTISVKNTGNCSLKDITVTDVLKDEDGNALSGVSVFPVGTYGNIGNELDLTFTIGDYLAAGDTAVYEARYTVTANDAGKTLINSVSAEGAGSMDAPGVTVKNPALSVTKTVNKTSVTVGDTVKYTITVKNTGNVKLTDVFVAENFSGDFSKIFDIAGAIQSENGFEIDRLDVGEYRNITFSYKTTKRETLTNSVKVTGTYESGKTVEDEDSSAPVTVKSEPITPVGPSKPQLNYEDHYAYVVGYPDGLVHPERNITRAEVATIFFRMLLDESREYFWAQENDFSDVAETDWFNNAVSTLANAQLINGYPDGSYRPNANITRAEFATIAIRFFLDEDVEIEENNLSDVKGHWAEANINLAYALELINGYPDGTFRPDQKITRAEAMAIVNRVLKRAPEKDHLLKDMIEWPDNLNTAAWYYADVQEATNSHKFHMDKEEEYEIWTELLPVRDWVALEQEWSKANSSKNPGEVVDIKITTPEAGDNGLKLD